MSKKNEWVKITNDNLPNHLLICEWKHPEYGIIKGNLVWTGGDKYWGQSWYVYPDPDPISRADISLSEFTHYRKIVKPNDKNQAKKPYARIDYLNCNPDYNYTICPWHEVGSQIQTSESNFTDVDEIGFNEWNDKSYLPEIKITLVMLTDKEFDKHFKKWDK